jgi:hypothetical protein
MLSIVARFKIVPGKEAEAEEAMKKMAGAVNERAGAQAHIPPQPERRRGGHGVRDLQG